MSTLFRDVCLYDGSMERARRADLLVEGGDIAQIGLPGTLSGEKREVLDGRGELLLLPGFFNAHCHAAMTLLRGLGEEEPLMEWLERKIWPLEGKLTPEQIYEGTSQAVCEMVKNGVTGFSDMYYHMDQVARAVNNLGVRGAIAVGVVSRNAELLEKSLYRDYGNVAGPRIVNNLDPHAPYTVTFEGMCRIAEVALQKDMPFQFHFLEAQWERDYIQKNFGLTPIQYLEKTGLMKIRRLVLAHGVWLNEEEIDYLAAHDAAVVHCPSSNTKLGSGVAPLPAMYAKNLRVALGTDGAASNNRLDLWDEMRLAALLHKGVSKDPTVVTARQLIRSATYEGARAFGFEKTGLLREGWTADFAAVDLKALHYIGADEENVAGYLVYAGSSADVRHVMCGGVWLMKDRVFLPRPEKDIREASSAMRGKLIASLQ